MRAPVLPTLLIGLALVFGACTNPAASSGAPTDAAATVAPATDAPATDAPASEPPALAMKVGYISLGDSIPFVKLVSGSIQAEADTAGVKIVFCDSELDQAKALAWPAPSS